MLGLHVQLMLLLPDALDRGMVDLRIVAGGYDVRLVSGSNRDARVLREVREPSYWCDREQPQPRCRRREHISGGWLDTAGRHLVLELTTLRRDDDLTRRFMHVELPVEPER